MNMLSGWYYSRSCNPTGEEVALWNHYMQDPAYRIAMLATLLLGVKIRRTISRAEKKAETMRRRENGTYDAWLKVKLERNKKYKPAPRPQMVNYPKPPKPVRPPKLNLSPEEMRTRVNERARVLYAERMKDPMARMRHRTNVLNGIKKLRASGHIRAYQQRRRSTNINVKLLDSLRKRFNESLHGKRKAAKVTELLGCTLDEFKAHIASKWEPWMDWSNYGVGKGKWVLDHVRPCWSFDLADPEQQKACFHYSNLAPLEYCANASKNSLHEGKRHNRKPCTPPPSG